MSKLRYLLIFSLFVMFSGVQNSSTVIQAQELSNIEIKDRGGLMYTEILTDYGEKVVIREISANDAASYMGDEILFIVPDQTNNSVNHKYDIQMNKFRFTDEPTNMLSEYSLRSKSVAIRLLKGGRDLLAGYVRDKVFEWVVGAVLKSEAMQTLAIIVMLYPIQTLVVVAVVASAAYLAYNSYKFRHVLNNYGCFQYMPNTNWVCQQR